MAVCPVCGCKTEELDFVVKKLNNQDCRVCSFCNRQLNVFDSVDEPTEAQLRWLSAVIIKDVPERDNNVSGALKDLRARFADKNTEQPATPAQQKVNVVQQGTVKKHNENITEDDLITELQNRITALENEIRAMKRKQMIKTIVELGTPFALLLLLVIIVLSSGVLDDLKALTDILETNGFVF